MDSDKLRVQLIETICQMPAEKLALVAAAIGDLDVPRYSQRSIHDQSSGPVGPVELKSWPHAPSHHLSEKGAYMVTCGTYQKAHLFRGRERLEHLENTLLKLAPKYDFALEAWAVFSNHYHFVGKANTSPTQLAELLTELHATTAREINRLDQTSGRQVWHNYWDTRLTYEKSYLARLNYVHQNAVRHGLVRVANQYPWCSAGWFESIATRAQVKTIYSFKIDRLRVLDDFEPLGIDSH